MVINSSRDDKSTDIFLCRADANNLWTPQSCCCANKTNKEKILPMLTPDYGAWFCLFYLFLCDMLW